MSRRPSTERYLALVSKLLAADSAIKGGEPPLAGAILALTAVNEFIGEDPNLRLNGVSTALRQLAAALHDTAVGTKPPILFGGGLVAEPGKAGRRTNVMRDQFRAYIVCAMNEMKSTGMKNLDAAKAVEGMLAKRGVRFDGKHIKATQIIQWREQSGDSGPAATDETIKRFAALRAQKPLPDTPQHAKAVAELLIKAVSWNNSN
jgi:hypothetical protein